MLAELTFLEFEQDARRGGGAHRAADRGRVQTSIEEDRVP